MKKSLLALAIIGAVSPLAAQAQSNVTVYGIVDAGIVRETGGAAGNLTAVSSGIGSASRLGFKGNEDLGDGVSALFVLETGYRVDTGAVDVAGSIFNRQSFVGIKSNAAGTFTLGRQYTPYYLTLSQVGDPFGAGYAGTAKNLFPTAGVNTRTSNTFVYASPVVNGFSGEFAYSLGEQPGGSQQGRQIGLGIGYTDGKLNVKLAHNYRNNDLTAQAGAAQVPPVAAASRDDGHDTLLAANYNFGPAKGYAAYSVDKGLNSAPLPNTSNPYGGVKPTASTDSRDYLVGVSVPMGANSFIASYLHKDDRTAFNQDASQIAVGLLHTMSSRTTAYAVYGKIRNEHGAGYTVGNNTDVGSGNAAYNLGIRHVF